MSAREELISGLQDALNLMKETSKLQDIRANFQTQDLGLHQLQEPWNRKKLLGTSILFGLATMVLIPYILRIIVYGMTYMGIDNTAVVGRAVNVICFCIY